MTTDDAHLPPWARRPATGDVHPSWLDPDRPPPAPDPWHDPDVPTDPLPF